jgi:zinc transporter
MQQEMTDTGSTIPGLLWAYRFRNDGTAKNLGPNVSRNECSRTDGWIWLHFSLSDERAKGFIADFDGFPESARATLLTADEHVNVCISDGVVHGIFVDLQRDLAGITDGTGKLHFAFNNHVLVSTRRAALHSVEAARQGIEAGNSIPAAVGLIEEIVSQYCITIERMISAIADEIEEIEDRVLEKRRNDDRQKLIPVRRLVMKLHRQLLASRGMFHRLESAVDSRLPIGLAKTATQIAQHLDSLDHACVVLQDRARLVHDEIVSKINAETNRSLHVLSTLSVLLMPPTLVAGAFGMNTKAVPFAQTDGGFWFALALCGLASAVAYGLLKKLDILN